MADPFGVPSPCWIWKRKEIQSWSWFHSSTGRNTSVATTHATYGPGSRSRARSDGRRTTAAVMVSGRRMLVYLDENARPRQMPAMVQAEVEVREPGGAWRARTTK